LSNSKLRGASEPTGKTYIDGPVERERLLSTTYNPSVPVGANEGTSKNVTFVDNSFNSLYNSSYNKPDFRSTASDFSERFYVRDPKYTPDAPPFQFVRKGLGCLLSVGTYVRKCIYVFLY
jgi:hypothetical protein